MPGTVSRPDPTAKAITLASISKPSLSWRSSQARRTPRAVTSVDWVDARAQQPRRERGYRWLPRMAVELRPGGSQVLQRQISVARRSRLA